MMILQNIRVLSAFFIFGLASCVVGEPYQASDLKKIAIDTANDNIESTITLGECYKYKYTYFSDSLKLDVIPKPVIGPDGKERLCGRGVTVLVDRTTKKAVAIPMR